MILTVVQATPRDEEFVQWHQVTTGNREIVLMDEVVVEFLVVKKKHIYAK